MSSRTIMGIDIETKDPDLKKLGTGVYRKDGGHVLGVSFCDDAGYNEYIDLGHEGLKEADRKRNLAKVATLLADPCPKLGANLIYDCDWLQNFLGLPVKGDWIDVQTAEALISEYRDSYSLDALAVRYLDLHKEKDEIQEFCDRNNLAGDPRAHLWRMPYTLVRKYALADTSLLLPIWTKQKAILEQENLMSLMQIESGILPMLIDMRKIGVRIDEKKRAELSVRHAAELESRVRKWESRYPGVNYNSSKQLAQVFDREGVPYDVSPSGKKELLARLGKTVDPKRLTMTNADSLFSELGMTTAEARAFRLANPSITTDVLEAVAEDFPIAREVEEIKRIDKVINTFIEGSLVRFQTDGRIHSSFYPTSSDEGGCRTGRFSSATPNLQQISKKKGSFDPEVRDCFIPEEGCWWIKSDLSGAEYRALLHYSRGKGSAEFQERWNRDPNLDIHATVQGWIGSDRTTAKRLGFGALYFLGRASMARKFRWTEEQAQDLMDKYLKAMPFIEPTRDTVLDVARTRGYVRTILGRHCRLSDSMKKNRKYYVAFNALLQGSVGDILKKAMHDAYKAGVFNIAPCHITCHDELDVSAPKTKAGLEAVKELKWHMEHAVSMRVPIVSEVEYGPNWGKGKVCDFEEMAREVL